MKKVAISGYFDPIHVGHIEYINNAKKLGDWLIVIVNNNKQCALKKGKHFMDENDRVLIVKNIKSVDEVRFFSNDRELENMVKSVKPDVMVVGSDWKGKSVIGSYWAAELKFFDRIEDYATTKTIQGIIDRG